MESWLSVFSQIAIVDLIALCIIGFYAFEGISLGLLRSTLDLISFVASFVLALFFYGVVARGLVSLFSIPQGFAYAIGFFILALVSEIIIHILLRFLYRTYTNKTLQKFHRTKLERYLGIVPGIASSCIILAFLGSVIVSLPTAPILKKQISESFIGGVLISSTSGLEKQMNSIFGEALHDTLTFMTIEPKSDEMVMLRFTVNNGAIDEQSEQAMLQMVNKQRVAEGLAPLEMDKKLQDLARVYSDDMFQKGYFSHYDLEGRSPFERMEQAGIQYGYAGENLALAPNVKLAMQGLMQSPGHRENILKPEFRKIGIGAIDGGIYGKMFTQEFTD